MCTAVTYQTRDHYFGRTLDLEYSYRETVTVTPRNYPLVFRKAQKLDTHYAMIGMAYVVSEYPLYYEATNEKGLSIAGLNFPDNAVYLPFCAGRDNIAPFEFIPWILGQCASLAEVRHLLPSLNLFNEAFNDDLPPSPLHWIIADFDGSITVEPTREGLKIYDNPVGVLTNNPPFEYHLTNLCNYMGLSRDPLTNRFAEGFALSPYSRGMGGIGLPGDLSSASRFIRAAFVKMNSVAGQSESESVSQFFHILGSVAQQRGCVRMENGDFELTVYTSCCNTNRGLYYYTTYENSRISCVDMYREDLDGTQLIPYPLIKTAQFLQQN